MNGAATEPGCAYVGLVPFTAADERFFFGRERETRLVINNLFASRLTLLYGPSGVGKSSVLGAGVLAELARRSAREETATRAAVYLRRWQGDPLVAFGAAVREAVRQARPGAAVAEPGEDEALVDWLARLTGDLELELLVLFDQFEEYFVYHQEPGRAVRDPFARQLAAMVERPELSVKFLLGLRDDALARLDRFKALIPDLFDNYLRLEPLSDAAAKEAIEKPLERWNEGRPAREQVRLGEGLVDHVVAQVRRDEEGIGGRGRPAGGRAGIQAPLLQLVMKRLWTAPTESRELSVATLERQLGGAEGIVEGHLDAVMEDLSASERHFCGRMFEYLVTPSGSKIAHSAADLAGFAKARETEVRPLLAKLAGSEKRLLATVAPLAAQGEELYEIYHDALGLAVLAWQQRWAAARARARTGRWLLVTAAFAVIAAVAIGAMWSARGASREARESAAQAALQEQEARRLAERATILAAEVQVANSVAAEKELRRLEAEARLLEEAGKSEAASRVRRELADVRRKQTELEQRIELLGTEIGVAPGVELVQELAALESENDALKTKLVDLASLLSAEGDEDLTAAAEVRMREIASQKARADRAERALGDARAKLEQAGIDEETEDAKSSGEAPPSTPPSTPPRTSEVGSSGSEVGRGGGSGSSAPPQSRSDGGAAGWILPRTGKPPDNPAFSEVVSPGPSWRDPATGMKFRSIPAGRFTMGSPKGEPGRDDDETRHEVTLTRGFWLAETEVTQGQWVKVMGNNPSNFKSCGPDCPVENVSWWDAVIFANALSKAARLEVCYALVGCTGQPGTSDGCESAELRRGLDCDGYRLPTEAEWEYATRAGTTTALYTGDLTIVGDRNGPELHAIAWYGGNSGVEYDGGAECSGWTERQIPAKRCGPHPAAGKAANAWGLHDMLGNVWEWTGDYGIADYPTGAVTDPTGPDQGAERVLRGGSWSAHARLVRAAYRDGILPGVRLHYLGFRLSRGQAEPGAEPR